MLSLNAATCVINLLKTVNRCVQNNTMLICTKNHINWLSGFEDMNNQT